MERRTVIAIAIIIGLLGFAYGSAMDTLTSDPATWIRPVLGLVYVVYMTPGMTVWVFATICGLAGADLTVEGLLLLVPVSALCWLAAGAYVWFRRAAYIP